MKKFYSVLALAAAACLSAQAADVKTAVAISEATAELAEMETVAPAPQKAAAKAPAADMTQLLGEYTGTYYLPLKGYEGQQTGSYAVVPTTGNGIEVYGIVSDTPVPGTVDFAAGTITLPGTVDLGIRNFGGTTGKKQVILKHMRWNNDGKGTYDASTTNFMLKIVDGGIKSESDLDIYMGEIQGVSGSYMLCGGYAFEFIKMPTMGGDTWYTAGDATFVDDGFFLPNWGWTAGTPPTLSCELQLNSAEPDLIGLYDPYGGLAAVVGEDLQDAHLPGRIVLNVGNKDCVYMPYGYVGAINDGLWYGTNMEAVQVEEGTTPDEIVNFLGKDALSNYNTETGVIVLKNCLWTCGNQRNQSWKAFYEEYVLPDDPTEHCPDDTFTIMLNFNENGLVNIAADENAPVEYYNLQGMKVENPAAGLYIKRQGNTVTKVIL